MRTQVATTRNASWWLCFWQELGEIQLPLVDGRHWFKPHLGINRDCICTLRSGLRFKIVFSNAENFQGSELPLLIIPDCDPDRSWWWKVSQG